MQASVFACALCKWITDAQARNEIDPCLTCRRHLERKIAVLHVPAEVFQGASGCFWIREQAISVIPSSGLDRYSGFGRGESSRGMMEPPVEIDSSCSSSKPGCQQQRTCPLLCWGVHQFRHILACLSGLFLAYTPAKIQAVNLALTAPTSASKPWMAWRPSIPFPCVPP